MRLRTQSWITASAILLLCAACGAGSATEPRSTGEGERVALAPSVPTSLNPALNTGSIGDDARAAPTPPTVMPSEPAAMSTTVAERGHTTDDARMTRRVIVTIGAGAGRPTPEEAKQLAEELATQLGDHGEITRVFEFTGQLVADVDADGERLLRDHPAVAGVDVDEADSAGSSN